MHGRVSTGTTETSSSPPRTRSTTSCSSTPPRAPWSNSPGPAAPAASPAMRAALPRIAAFWKGGGRVPLQLEKIVPALNNPVSVAFGRHHLYILTTTYIESHPIGPYGISATPDGKTRLAIADGSAAQVGVLDGQLVISEKSNAIETVNLDYRGAISGSPQVVANIPANVNAPFGLATRGDDAYVTIAHADEISLVRNNAVLTVTGSGTQM